MFTISFKKFNAITRTQDRIGLAEACHVLDVDPSIIWEAFQTWCDKGYPQEYLHDIENTGKLNANLEPIHTFLRIWNYRGEGWGVGTWGRVSTVRPWGRGFRIVGSTRQLLGAELYYELNIVLEDLRK